MILTDLGGYSSAAGFVGSEVEVGHDISMLVPELWCRLTAAEKDPRTLIEQGMLQKIEDYTYQGRTILASRLGYRITLRFVRRFFGRLFDNPDKVFDTRILCPETQDEEGFADGVDHIVEAHRKVAQHYFDDGSFELACPPLQALLRVMVDGHCQGTRPDDPAFRQLFSRQALLDSDWYRARLSAKQAADIRLWQRHHDYLQQFCAQASHDDVVQRMDLLERIDQANKRLAFFSSPDYLVRLTGTLGADPHLVFPSPVGSAGFLLASQ